VRLRVVCWNIDGLRLQLQPELLRETPWDVCLLQEVADAAQLREIGRRAGASAWHGAFAHADSFLRGRARPRQYAAALVREPFRLVAPGVLDGVPAPERTLVAVAERDDVRVSLASLAAPSGGRLGAAERAAQCEGIAGWLAGREPPLVAYVDVGAPRRERLDPADCEFSSPAAALVLGPDGAHGLVDVYRSLLERDARLREQALAARPDGPLAVSHTSRNGVVSRPDVLLASADLTVETARYAYDRAVAVGSDHALVVAELGLAT
jgi:endonuclease/exonuclease/phosphatase family metal-dependent hydrolase